MAPKFPKHIWNRFVGGHHFGMYFCVYIMWVMSHTSVAYSVHLFVLPLLCYWVYTCSCILVVPPSPDSCILLFPPFVCFISPLLFVRFFVPPWNPGIRKTTYKTSWAWAVPSSAQAGFKLILLPISPIKWVGVGLSWAELSSVLSLGVGGGVGCGDFQKISQIFCGLEGICITNRYKTEGVFCFLI